jgi:hypothetical protein
MFCGRCGTQLSDTALYCSQCGAPTKATHPAEAVLTPTPATGGTECPYCHKLIIPMVHSVGGGSCTVGSRERWTCPSCRRVIFRKGCLVATSTYGDENFVEVQFLRAFRDSVLVRSSSGRFLTTLYYRVSPYLVWPIEKIPSLKYVMRRVLDFVVLFIERNTSLRREQFRK